MRFTPHRALIAIALVLGASAAYGASSPAAFPTRPIRVLVPQNPGASNDTITRIVAAKMTKELRQQFIVDNRPGAGGTIAGSIVAHAAPDGYTLFATATASQVIGPQVIQHINYDPEKSFAPISLMAMTVNVLVVNPKVPVHSVKELIAYTKAHPGKLNMANAGTGTQSHLAGVLLAKAAGLDVTMVPYKGGGASVGSVIAGESQVTITPAPAVLGHIRAGALRGLATGGAKRSRLMPELPTLIESGVNLESTGWIGMLAPKGTPKAVIDTLHKALVEAINDPDTQKIMERQGADPAPDTPAEFGRFMAAEWKRFGEAIRLAHLKAY